VRPGELLRLSRRPSGPRPLHFLHVGKTGGSAVKHALGLAPAETGRFVIHLDGEHRKTLHDVPEGEAAFFFVREPLARFVSAFYSRQRQGMPHDLHPWKDREREAFATFHTANALAEAISARDQALRFEARQAMRAIGHVNTQYAKWFESPRYFRSRRNDIVFVGRQETLDADFERLKTLVGLPRETALPADDVVAHRNPGGVDRSLSNLARTNLEAWYRADFEFLEFLASHGFLARLASTVPS